MRFNELYEITEATELRKIINKRILLLGGGSNTLITAGSVDIPVVRILLKGIEVTKISASESRVVAAAGEDWISFVDNLVNQGLGGIENLSYIPGSVGAAPVQNIGAYGIEQDQIFDYLEAFNTKTGEMEKFDKTMCGFGYRDSYFKHALEGIYIITKVAYKLTNPGFHKLRLDYPDVVNYIKEHNLDESSLDPKKVADIVVGIRKRKLPDPKEIGTAGSFFKNPVISTEEFQHLKKLYPEIPSYYVSDTQTKLPAAWLIDQAGWKGKRFGDAGVHPNQALVLVNHGNATGKEIWQLAEKITRSVSEKFGIDLVPEVNIVQ